MMMVMMVMMMVYRQYQYLQPLLFHSFKVKKKRERERGRSRNGNDRCFASGESELQPRWGKGGVPLWVCKGTTLKKKLKNEPKQKKKAHLYALT